jgi:hypothetical protein
LEWFLDVSKSATLGFKDCLSILSWIFHRHALPLLVHDLELVLLSSKRDNNDRQFGRLGHRSEEHVLGVVTHQRRWRLIPDENRANRLWVLDNRVHCLWR